MDSYFILPLANREHLIQRWTRSRFVVEVSRGVGGSIFRVLIGIKTPPCPATWRILISYRWPAGLPGDRMAAADCWRHIGAGITAVHPRLSLFASACRRWRFFKSIGD